MNVEKRTEILEKAGETFMKYGIRSVTMDDLARALRISKKTLYQYVTDKNDLVVQCFGQYQEMDKCTVKELRDQNLNAIDELFELSEMVGNQLQEVHPSIFFDLEKYHPEAWNEFNKFKREFIYQHIYENMENGKREELYRDDVNSEIIAINYITRMDDMFNPDIYPPSKFKFREVYLELMRYHIRGIASQKGIDYLVKKVQEERSKLS